jgi:hypothetical protein
VELRPLRRLVPLPATRFTPELETAEVPLVD